MVFKIISQRLGAWTLAWFAANPASTMKGKIKHSAATFASTTGLSVKTFQDKAVIATIKAVLTRLSLTAPENIVTRSPRNP